jgi:preprotein translocase subunit SecF
LIAACLTILGYSINATIVVFDRVRENNNKFKLASFEDNANLAVNQTLARSINTTITTLLTIGMVYILGVDSIKNFALPIIVGIIAGVFSSVFLGAPLWCMLNKVFTKKAKSNKKELKA